MSRLEAATERAFAAWLRFADGEAAYLKAEGALTLHMLQFHAPRFFAAHGLEARLEAALEALAKVPPGFGPKVGPDEALARLDALYLRRLRGLKVRKFDPDALTTCIGRVSKESPLHGWLMARLAEPLGVKAEVPLKSRWPFRDESHLYHLTHLVLVATRYLASGSREGLGDELAELERRLPRVLERQWWDCASECIFCLNRLGVPTPAAVEALLGAQRDDGSFSDFGAPPRVQHHCTAAALIALAGALDLSRPAP